MEATGILTKKQIGQRIMELRKRRDLSQSELAQKIQMSRPSLAQIELGNRGLDVIELQKLSHVLRFSLDDFMAIEFKYPDQEHELDISNKNDIRISVPNLQIGKFKNVLLYILERCAGKPNVGETVLYKLLYFSDFNYYELYEEQLTGACYRKLPYGPIPEKMDALINQLIEAGQIQRIKTEYNDQTLIRYIPLVKADLTCLKASEKEVIDRVIEQMSDWSEQMIMSYAHLDMPWKASEVNEAINYELAFYRQPPYSIRLYEEDEQDTI